MTHNYGKQIYRRLYPEENYQPIALPTQAPAIHLFDSQPSLEDAASGAGALQTLDSWTASAITPFPRLYSFTAVSDPSPTSAIVTRTYWEALNYILEAGGETQTILRTFDLERTAGAAEEPGTTAIDLQAIYPAITAYATLDQLNDQLGIALEEIKTTLRARGMEWAYVSGQSQLKLALAYKAISLVALSQIRERDDKHELRFREFENKYQAQMNIIELKVDTDKDGDYDEVKEPSRFYMINER